MTSIAFDNCYVTDDFARLDKRREKKGKTAVLPLRAKENSKYVKPNGLVQSWEGKALSVNKISTK